MSEVRGIHVKINLGEGDIRALCERKNSEKVLLSDLLLLASQGLAPNMTFELTYNIEAK